MLKKTLIIAEAGVNHNGDINMARELIDVASESGADIVKFQTFNAKRQVTRLAQKANYQIKTTDSLESQQEMLSRLELTEQMHHELIAHCNLRRIRFLSTGFDIESINFLMTLGQEFIKIPSGEITNLPYLRHIGQFNKKIILSTGMSTLGDIEAAVDVLENAGTLRSKLAILHCTTEYPTPMHEVNLRAIKTLHSAFGVPIGYSDHTSGIEIAIAAVAMGATIIEKHFTLSRELPGPDHRASLEPAELIAMVGAIRNVEVAMGSGIKRPTESENRNKIIVRKSIVAKQNISKGEIFTLENIATKRPGAGISPMKWDEILGKVAKRNFVVDELIEL
jgi:N,N'-diacetyllegionaminate synthase